MCREFLEALVCYVLFAREREHTVGETSILAATIAGLPVMPARSRARRELVMSRDTNVIVISRRFLVSSETRESES